MIEWDANPGFQSQGAALLVQRHCYAVCESKSISVEVAHSLTSNAYRLQIDVSAPHADIEAWK